jgi:hypothetical protein
MDDSTQPPRRVTSAQRAVTVLWLQRGTRDLDLSYLIAWADACAALLDAEHGASARLLLHHLLDEAPAEAAFAVTSGGLFTPPDEVTLRRELRAAKDAAPIQPPPLPWWAEHGTWNGPANAPPPVFSTETLDLGADPAAWPPVTVAAFAFGNQPPTVLVEVSPAPASRPTSSRGRPAGWLLPCCPPPTWSIRLAPAGGDDS